MIPPQGAVPQQQAQGGAPAQPQAPRGSAPQAGVQGKSNLTQDQIEALKKDPEILQVFQMLLGRPIPLDNAPDDIIAEVAGMVHKLGVNGAVAMLNKVIPADKLSQMKKKGV